MPLETFLIGGAIAGKVGLSLYSGTMQAENIMWQYDLNSQIADMNAEYAELDAERAETFGESQIVRYQKIIDQTVEKQRTTFTAQGVDTSSGTAKDVLQETRLTGFLNSLDMRKEAINKAYGYRVQASNIRLQNFMQGVQSRIQANDAIVSSRFNAINEGLSGYLGGRG